MIDSKAINTKCDKIDDIIISMILSELDENLSLVKEVEAINQAVINLRDKVESLETETEEVDVEDFDTKFQSFFNGCCEIYNNHMDTYFPTLTKEEMAYKVNKKYIRVTHGSSVFAFVNKETGDVLKPASYKAPAKHARGNVFDSNNGLGMITAYGVAYLR